MVINKVESRVESFNNKWHANFNQGKMMLNFIFDHFQIRPPIPFPLPIFSHSYNLFSAIQGPIDEDVNKGM